jgi:hypothetical protein
VILRPANLRRLAALTVRFATAAAVVRARRILGLRRALRSRCGLRTRRELLRRCGLRTWRELLRRCGLRTWRELLGRCGLRARRELLRRCGLRTWRELLRRCGLRTRRGLRVRGLLAATAKLPSHRLCRATRTPALRRATHRRARRPIVMSYLNMEWLAASSAAGAGAAAHAATNRRAASCRRGAVVASFGAVPRRTATRSARVNLRPVTRAIGARSAARTHRTDAHSGTARAAHAARRAVAARLGYMTRLATSRPARVNLCAVPRSAGARTTTSSTTDRGAARG